MKKSFLILILIVTLWVAVACKDNTNQKPSDKEANSQVGGEQNGGGTNNDENNADSGSSSTPDDNPDSSTNKDPDDKPIVDPDDTTGGEADNNDDSILASVLGLNEEIKVSIAPKSGYTYKVYYKNSNDNTYNELDENLMITEDELLNCYILGIESGNYEIKIEAEGKNSSFIKQFSDINVLKQDRSGYAHFGYTGGVGAYNDDGTVKEGTNIIYVTNENKNTVKLTINGTEYVGLVKILQAQYKSNVPLLIRVIGSIKTNQWNYKNVEPRLADNSNLRDDFFENTFSTEYGENLANLIVKYNDQYGKLTYKYNTTASGLGNVSTSKRGAPSTTTYKGSDFPALEGETVYDDDCYFNMLEVSAASNITIEGVGSGAEFFQFGIGFERCNSIEIKNIAFTNYPEDALNFIGRDRAELANYSNYWVHNCTFNRGYNAWDLSGERDKYAGDGSIDFNNVSNTTLSYNLYNNCKKSMLFGNSDSQACMNFTMHHNYFYKVESRLPLGRNVNIHSYNNYFDQCKNCSDIRKNSYLFSENNYFNSTSKPFILSSSAVKSFGDIFVSSSNSGATKVTDRTKTVSNSCKPDGSIDYSKFDTNPSLFYYDSTKKQTIVSLMLDAEDVPKFVKEHAGAGIKVPVLLTK